MAQGNYYNRVSMISMENLIHLDKYLPKKRGFQYSCM